MTTIAAVRGLALAAALFGAAPALAQGADTVLLNGKIVTLEGAATQEALAVRDGKVLAVGRSADIRGLAGPNTKVIDLGGRTVIPGLIDSHMHAIRAALFYATEVNWIGTRSIPEAMERIRAAAKARQARAVDHRRRRLDRAAVRREAAPDAGGAARRRARPSGLHPAVLCGGAALALRLQGAQHHARRGRAAARQDRARRARQSDRLDRRRQPDHHGAVRQAAAADVRAEGRGHARRSSASSTGSG